MPQANVLFAMSLVYVICAAAKVAQATFFYRAGAFFIYKRYVTYAGLFVSFVSKGAIAKET